MSERFQIRSPEGATYELTNPEFFLDEYEPKGYVIVADPPADHIVPDIDAIKAKRAAKAKQAAAKESKKDE